MKIRNPKYPWKPSHGWDNCPGCFEQFDLKTCDHCGSGHPDEYVEVEPPPTALDLAREEIAELKRQLKEWRDQAHQLLSNYEHSEKQLAESQAREARLREAIDAHVNPCGCFNGCEFCNGKTPLEEALALPHDDTALKEYRDAEAEFADARFQKLFDDYSKVKTELEAARGVLGQFQYYRDGRSVRCAPPECDVLASCKKAP